MVRHIAIVEDEPAIAENYRDAFQRQGFQVSLYDNRPAAMAAFCQTLPDLAVIDVGLGDDVEGGFELCRELRSLAPTLPIVFLTARDDELDVISGLRLGADDYLTKPFDLDILEARMKALVRRYHGTVASSKLVFGEISIDQKTRKAYRQDKLLALNPTTYTILEMLCKSAPDVVTREDISYKLWEEDEPNNDVLRSHIYQLRNQLDKPFDQQMLITVPKIGFRLESNS